jgi:uncharacterized protein DUF1259
MTDLEISQLSRRNLLLAGGTAALAATVLTGAATPAFASGTALPAEEMQEILQADGMVSDGVLEVDIDRSDLHVTGPAGTPFVDGFQIQHELYFQSLGSGKAIFNGDVALRPSETQRVIDGIERQGLVFQAFHQHLYDLTPMVWFIHFRGVGEPLDLARKVHRVVKLTSTPLPQHSPAHPSTPLPADKLAAILGGDASVGDNGVVTVTVTRKTPVLLGGVRVKPELGVSTSVQFQPLGHGQAAVVPDFSMTASEVNPVTQTMRRQGWDIGCLYNQEIDEQPQLFFSHAFKRGDAVRLAHEVREGLEHTAV